MPSQYKPIPIKPLTGLLDVRSEPDQMPPEAFRFRESFSSDENGMTNRARGFKRFLSGNADYHDQLLPLQTFYDFKNPRVPGDNSVTLYPNSSLCGNTLKTRTNGRELVNFGFMAKSISGQRRLLIGTKSRIAVLNESTNNYRLLADGQGGPVPDTARRWQADTLKNKVVFTNGFNQPTYWPIDGPATGCEMQSALPIPDMNLIAMSRVGVVVQYHGVMFYMDVTLNNTRFPNRIHWSDLDDATSLDPAKANSITGFTTLDDGEIIINAIVNNDQLIVLTNQGIWVSSTGAPFNFTKVYTNFDGARCIRYKYTLCAIGFDIFYGGREGFYIWNYTKGEPELVDWLHAASGVVFKGIPGYSPINSACCDSTHAVFKPDINGEDGRGEIYLSWAETGSCDPTKTMVINYAAQFAYTLPWGFGMFVNYVSDNRPSLRDWLLGLCSCTLADLASLNVPIVKEGLLPPIECPPPGGFIPQSIYTKNLVTLFDSVQEENFDWPQADPDSLCALLAGKTLDDYCNLCDATPYFIGSSTEDFCLKLVAEGYTRERCTNPNTPTGPGTPYQNQGGEYFSFPGTYQGVGYYSIMRGAANNFGSMMNKVIKRFIAELKADEMTVPCVLQLRIGKSYQCVDPNATGIGGVQWCQPVRQPFQNPNTETAEELEAANLIPGLGVEFPLDQQALWLYWELTIGTLSDPDDPDSPLLPALGGAGSLSAVYQTVRQDPKGLP